MDSPSNAYLYMCKTCIQNLDKIISNNSCFNKDWVHIDGTQTCINCGNDIKGSAIEMELTNMDLLFK